MARRVFQDYNIKTYGTSLTKEILMTTQYMIPDLIDQTGFEQSFEHRDEN